MKDQSPSSQADNNVKFVVTPPGDERELKLSEVLEYLQRVELVDERESVIDALTLALAAERIDPILTRIRYRSQFLGVVSLLSDAIQTATHVAGVLGVEMDGSPVGATRDFSDWNEDKLRRLAILTEVESGRLRRAAEASAATLAEQAEAIASRDAAVEKLKEELERTRQRIESLIEHYKAELLEVRSALGAQVDTDEFVVAAVDPVTRKPAAYLAEFDGGWKAVRRFEDAFRFGTFRDAQRVRVRTVVAKRAKLRANQKSDRLGVRPTFDVGSTVAVMRISHAIVTAMEV